MQISVDNTIYCGFLVSRPQHVVKSFLNVKQALTWLIVSWFVFYIHFSLVAFSALFRFVYRKNWTNYTVFWNSHFSVIDTWFAELAVALLRCGSIEVWLCWGVAWDVLRAGVYGERRVLIKKLRSSLYDFPICIHVCVPMYAGMYDDHKRRSSLRWA